MKESGKVNVCMVTYNHEKYIAQAIESVLMQETSFEVVLLIGEDCSTDDTRAICVEYATRFPNKIKLIAHEHNIGMMPNFMTLLKQCTAPYIALLDGDDYWTDPTKLQKQVDFMETHPDCVVCFHDAKVVSDDGIVLTESKLGEKNRCDATSFELKKGKLMPTASVVFKNVIESYPSEMANVGNGDSFLWALLGQYGGAKFMNGVSPVAYRQHSGGVYSFIGKREKLVRRLKTIKALQKFYRSEPKVSKHYHNKLRKVKYTLLKVYFKGILEKLFQRLK